MRRYLKKLTAMGMAAAMVFSLAGCGGSNDSGEKSSPAAPSTEASVADAQPEGTENTSEGEPVTLKITWWGARPGMITHRKCWMLTRHPIPT